MMIRMGFGAALLALTLLSSRAAQAAPTAPQQFGERGQLVLDQRMSAVGAYSHTSYGPGMGLGVRAFTFAPSASYFVLHRLSVGLSASVARTTFTASSSFHGSTTGVRVTPSVGYALPFADHFSAWPQLSASLQKGWGSGTGPASSTVWELNLAAPLLWQPAEHFFVGFGPSLDYQLARGYGASPQAGAPPIREWGVGLRTLIGGYFAP